MNQGCLQGKGLVAALFTPTPSIGSSSRSGRRVCLFARARLQGFGNIAHLCRDVKALVTGRPADCPLMVAEDAGAEGCENEISALSTENRVHWLCFLGIWNRTCTACTTACQKHQLKFRFRSQRLILTFSSFWQEIVSNFTIKLISKVFI